MSSERRTTYRTFTTEYKQHVVLRYKKGEMKCKIVMDEDITRSMLDEWIAE